MVTSELVFKNFNVSDEYISADLILNGQYIMRISDHILHIENMECVGVVLYDRFREASLEYMRIIGVFR
jgi:hypothetical protein